jgi:hypothetical protein
MYLSYVERNPPMTFVDALIASGYVFDDEDYDGCYVKQDAEGFVHLYQQHEEEGLWNYVKMTDEFDVIREVTFDPNVDTIQE